MKCSWWTYMAVAACSSVFPHIGEATSSTPSFMEGSREIAVSHLLSRSTGLQHRSCASSGVTRMQNKDESEEFPEDLVAWLRIFRGARMTWGHYCSSSFMGLRLCLLFCLLCLSLISKCKSLELVSGSSLFSRSFSSRMMSSCPSLNPT